MRNNKSSSLIIFLWRQSRKEINWMGSSFSQKKNWTGSTSTYSLIRKRPINCKRTALEKGTSWLSSKVYSNSQMMNSKTRTPHKVKLNSRAVPSSIGASVTKPLLCRTTASRLSPRSRNSTLSIRAFWWRPAGMTRVSCRLRINRARRTRRQSTTYWRLASTGSLTLHRHLTWSLIWSSWTPFWPTITPPGSRFRFSLCFVHIMLFIRVWWTFKSTGARRSKRTRTCTG